MRVHLCGLGNSIYKKKEKKSRLELELGHVIEVILVYTLNTRMYNVKRIKKRHKQNLKSIGRTVTVREL